MDDKGGKGRCCIKQTTWEVIALVQVKEHDDQTYLGYVLKVEFPELADELDARYEQKSTEKSYKLDNGWCSF